MSYKTRQDLSGRRALVTGAGQGIGAAVAAALAETGADVLCTDISRDRAEATASSLVAQDFSARAATLDVTDSAGISALAGSEPAFDVLVCNAGIVSNTPAEDMSDDEWDKVIGVNLTGVFRCCRGFGRGMLARGSGSIVVIGSMSGHVVNTPQPQCHYNASKAGVHQLVKSLAVEWAERGVRVNAVAPTYIATPLLEGLEAEPGLIDRWLDLTPMKRMGRPEEVASVVQFLASDASSLMTGSIVSADAGYSSI